MGAISPPQVAQARTNGLAVASLVTGILGWFLLSLPFGFIAKRQIDGSGGLETGRGLAIAGIVLGFISLALWTLAVVVILGIGVTTPTTATSTEPPFKDSTSLGRAPVIETGQRRGLGASQERHTKNPDGHQDPSPTWPTFASPVGTRLRSFVHTSRTSGLCDEILERSESTVGPYVVCSAPAPVNKVVVGAYFRIDSMHAGLSNPGNTDTWVLVHKPSGAVFTFEGTPGGTVAAHTLARGLQKTALLPPLSAPSSGSFSDGANQTTSSPEGSDTATNSTSCTSGYSRCLAPASDYDCFQGGGDGPKYTGFVRVSGDDPYGLDADGDGVGCED